VHKESKRQCPSCGSHEVVPILYGLLTPEAEEDVKAGKVALGGCIVSGRDPAWRCKECRHEWGKLARR
jgi:predicted RNA-binding Zn-ribbon protein involved in translation (DUF1610 family)